MLRTLLARSLTTSTARSFGGRSVLVTSNNRAYCTGKNEGKFFDSESDFDIPEATSIMGAPEAEEVVIKNDRTVKINLDRYERSMEMQEDAARFLREDKFEKAASNYISCIGTYRAYLEFKLGDGNPQTFEQEKANLLLDPTIGLAFSQQCLGRLEDALETYEDVFGYLKTSPPADNEKSIRCILNHAELLCQAEKPLLAIEKIKTVVDQAENKSGELYASALANLAMYHAVIGQYEEATPYAKKGYELFSKVLGRNNPFTESALQGYMRVLRDSGKVEEAEALQKEWEETRRKSELPSNDSMQQVISEKLGESLKHLSHKKTLDPKGVIVPPEVLENQKKKFEESYSEADFGDARFVEEIEPELKNLYDLVGKSHEFHSDLEKFKADPQFARETLERGVGAPIFDMSVTEYYKTKGETLKE